MEYSFFFYFFGNTCFRNLYLMEYSSVFFFNIVYFSVILKTVDVSITPENILLIGILNENENNNKKKNENKKKVEEEVEVEEVEVEKVEDSSAATQQRPTKRSRTTTRVASSPLHSTTTSFSSTALMTILFIFLFFSCSIAAPSSSNNPPKDRVELEAGPDIIPPTLDVPEIPRSMIETGECCCS